MNYDTCNRARLAGGLSLRALISVITSLCILAVSAPVFAQETTSSIRGTVTDAAGAAVANAAISVRHIQTGTTKNVRTNSAGKYRVPGLRVGGPYEVVLAPSAGNGGTRISDVFLELGEAFDLNIAAGEGNVEEVLVSAIRQDPGLAMGASSLFNSENIVGQANVNRDFKNVIRQDPRVTLDSTNFNAISIAGTNNRFNSLTVDGVRQNDDFGLNGSGFPTQRSPISIDAIEQVSVEISPFDVSYGGFTGGTINAVTKSGTNDWDGSFAFFRTHDGLIGDSIDSEPVDLGQFEEETISVTASGPIIKDRLWFFASYEDFSETDVSGLEFGPAGSGRANEIDNVTQADIDEVIRIARDVYGFDAGVLPNSGTDVVDEKLLVKLDFALNENHNITATYQDVSGNALVPQGNSSFSQRIGLPSNWYDRSEELTSISAQWFADWSDAFSTELKIASQERVTGQNSLNGTDFAQMDITVGMPGDEGVIRIGPDIFRHANRLSNDQFQVKFKGDYLYGDHQISFGIERDNLDIFNVFLPRSEGEYEFDSLADFEARMASDFNYTNAITNVKEDGGATFEYQINSAYIQDTWDINERLTLLYGVRYDWYTSDDKPNLNPGFTARNGFSNQETLDGRNSFMPRLGLTFQYDDRTEFRGGIGIFSGGSPNVWVSNAYTNDGVSIVSPDDAGNFDATCAGVLSSADALTNVDGFAIPQAVQNCMFPGAGDVNATDPDFEIPSVVRYNLAVEREFDFGRFGDGWNVTAEAILSRAQEAVEWRELRRQQVGTAPDGRPIYDTPPNYDVVLTNTGEGKSDTYSVSLDKGWDTSLGLFDAYVSYTYSDVEDVNPAQSSTVSSNYGRPATFDRNGRLLATSDFEIEDRFAGSFGWQRQLFGNNTTRVNVFVESRSGRPFSYTMRESPFDTAVFGGDGDFARRDSQLMYVPAMNDPNVIFNNTAGSLVNDPALEAEFNAFIAGAGLDGLRGQILPRNFRTTRGASKIDVRIQQEIGVGTIPVLGDARLDLFLDIENFGNLINDDWGRVEQVGFPYNSTAVGEVSINGNGQYVYGEQFSSQWEDALDPAEIYQEQSLYKIQLGFKVSF